jgi:hypothetical protein
MTKNIPNFGKNYKLLTSSTLGYSIEQNSAKKAVPYSMTVKPLNTDIRR